MTKEIIIIVLILVVIYLYYQQKMVDKGIDEGGKEVIDWDKRIKWVSNSDEENLDETDLYLVKCWKCQIEDALKELRLRSKKDKDKEAEEYPSILDYDSDDSDNDFWLNEFENKEFEGKIRERLNLWEFVKGQTEVIRALENLKERHGRLLIRAEKIDRIIKKSRQSKK